MLEPTIKLWLLATMRNVSTLGGEQTSKTLCPSPIAIGTELHKIVLNYRSTPDILDLANGVL